MDCDENGRKRTVPARAGRRVFKRKCGAGGEGDLQLAVAAAVPGTSLERPMRINLVSPCPPDLSVAANVQTATYPFMNNMDAISYWVYTKRAPCLFKYDNIVKKQVEQAHCSNNQPQAVSPKSKHEDEPTPKRKKKLKLLGEDSVSSEKQQNIYFKSSQLEKTASSCKSEPHGSEVDFNIKNSSVQKKSRKTKMQRNIQPTIHKKNKVVTSKPKTVHLRRSLRKAQHDHNKSNMLLNDSFKLMYTNVINGNQDMPQGVKPEPSKPEKVDNEERTKSKVILPNTPKPDVVLNGRFEDLSDVSGLTANYIRSTKLHASKSARKLRNRTTRTLIKETKQREHQDKMIMCINKSVITGFPDTTALNCSTESSQNTLNLVTVKNTERSARVNKSTSLLKFMETNLDSNINNKIHKQESKNNINISFQSRSSGASRYPRRHKNNTTETPDCSTNINSKVNSSSKKYNTRKAKTSSNRKENSEEKIISKTRSGRKIGLKLNVKESGCSMMQLNNPSEPVSSSLAINVACPNEKHPKQNNYSSRCLRSHTSRDKSGQLYKDTASDGSNDKHPDGVHYALNHSTPKCAKQVKKSTDKIRQSSHRDSLRDKSGFAACFSDSDSDCEPLKQQKFFC